MFPILRKSLRYLLSSSNLINLNALKKGKLYYFLEFRFPVGNLRLYHSMIICRFFVSRYWNVNYHFLFNHNSIHSSLNVTWIFIMDMISTTLKRSIIYKSLTHFHNLVSNCVANYLGDCVLEVRKGKWIKIPRRGAIN